MRRLGSKPDETGTAESLPLMDSTGALSRGESTIETLQEGGEGEENCLDEDFDLLGSIPQVREKELINQFDIRSFP
jgi:hypothetical protein